MSGDTIKLYANAYAGFNFSWSGPNGFSSTQQNPVIPNARSVNGGTYTLTLTVPGGGGGCVYNYTHTAVVVNKPAITVASTASTICRNDSVTLSLSSNSGLSTANWYTNTGVTCTPNGNFLGTGFTKTVAPLNTTKYIAIGITTIGGCKDTTTNCYTVTVDTMPVLTSPFPTSSPLCYGRGSMATITPGFGGTGCTETYQWRMDGGSWRTYTSGTYVGATANDSVEIRATRNCAFGCINKVVRLKWNITQPQVTVGTGNLFTCVNGAGFVGTLTSTNPAPSSGIWTIISGPGTIASATSFNTTIGGLSKTGQLTKVGWVVTNSYGCKDTAIVNFTPPYIDSTMVSKYSNEYCITCPVAEGNEYSYYDLDGKLLARLTDSIDAVDIGSTPFCGQLHYNVALNPSSSDVRTVTSWIEGAGYIPQPYLPRAWNFNTTNDGPMTVKLYFTDEEVAALQDRAAMNGGHFSFDGDVNRLLLVAYPNNSETFIPPGSPNGMVFKPVMERIGSYWQATIRLETSATMYLYPPYWAQYYGLPVELTSFKATAIEEENYIRLDWTTASEINNEGFDIERGNDTRNLTKIGFVAGAGNARSIKAYSLDDEDVEPDKIYYYRLKQLDLDGKFNYSNIVSAMLNPSNEFKISQLFPNPANNSIFVNIYSTKTMDMDISIFRMDGALIKNIQSTLQKGNNELMLDINGIEKGYYTVQFSSGVGKWVQKMLKLD